MCVAGCLHVHMLFHLPEKMEEGFFFFQRQEADEKRRNPADERTSDDEGKMEMSSGARIGFR